MRKLLSLIIFLIIFVSCFNNSAYANRTSLKESATSRIKRSKKAKVITRQRIMDCYPIEIKSNCGTFFEIMCSDQQTSAEERQRAFKQISDMYKKALCPG